MLFFCCCCWTISLSKLFCSINLDNIWKNSTLRLLSRLLCTSRSVIVVQSKNRLVICWEGGIGKVWRRDQERDSISERKPGRITFVNFKGVLSQLVEKLGALWVNRILIYLLTGAELLVGDMKTWRLRRGQLTKLFFYALPRFNACSCSLNT